MYCLKEIISNITYFLITDGVRFASGGNIRHIIIICIFIYSSIYI